jgi:hypothetical protein
MTCMMKNLILQAQGSTECLRKDSNLKLDGLTIDRDPFHRLLGEYNTLRKPLPSTSPILRNTLQEEHTDLEVRASETPSRTNHEGLTGDLAAVSGANYSARSFDKRNLVFFIGIETKLRHDGVEFAMTFVLYSC